MITFGCRLNAVESDAILESARAAGLSETVVVNTCAVTAEAVRQARQAIRKARRERPDANLVVTGCAAQIAGADFAAMPEVSRVVGNADKADASALRGAERLAVSDIFQISPRGHSAAGAPQGRARGYVEIQNGCDHRCTFCVIPFGRGNSRSIPSDIVVSRVRDLAAAGVAEVVLTGVDLTSWGAGLPGEPKLGDLVRRVLREVSDLPRLRLSSIDAAEIDPELMACLAEERRLMPHLHLSLQSGDDLILKRMKRRHSRADALALVAAVRAVRPEVAFGADLIAGFPTESDTAFENTLSLIEEAGVAYVHAFPYSPRPGTPAARMPQVATALVKERAARLRAAGEAALRRHLEGRVGTSARALVEQPGRARAEDFTEVTFAGEASAGTVIEGVIASHDDKRAHILLPLREKVASERRSDEGSTEPLHPGSFRDSGNLRLQRDPSSDPLRGPPSPARGEGLRVAAPIAYEPIGLEASE